MNRLRLNLSWRFLSLTTVGVTSGRRLCQSNSDAAGGLDAWDDIGEEDETASQQPSADKLLDRLVSEVEGADALSTEEAPRPSSSASAHRAPQPKQATRRRVALQSVASLRRLDEPTIESIAAALTAVLDGKEMTIIDAWSQLPDDMKAAIRKGGGGLRRWLHATNLFDVSGDDLAVAPLGSMSTARRERTGGFRLKEPSASTRAAFEEQVDGWFVELNVEGPLEPMPDPLGPDNAVDDAVVEKNIRAVQSARQSYVGEAIPPPPPPSASRLSPFLKTLKPPTLTAPVGPIPVAEAVKILSPPPPPPPPPGAAGLGLSQRSMPGGGGLRTPPPLPRAFTSPGGVAIGGASPVGWKSPSEMLDLFVDVVPTFFVSLTFLRSTPALEQVLVGARMSLPRMLKKHQFYFEVQRAPGAGPGDLPDIRLRTTVAHPRRGAADSAYEWAKRNEDGSLLGTPPPPPPQPAGPPRAVSTSGPQVALDTIESLQGRATPPPVTPPSLAPQPVINAFSKALDAALASRCETSTPVSDSKPFACSSRDIAAAVSDLAPDDVLRIAAAHPDVFLFLGTNGLPPADGITLDTPVTLRPLSVAPGACGAFGVNNSPTPKIIAALGRIVPRGIWAPIPKVTAKLDAAAKLELEDSKLSLATIARAHGRLLYVHPDGESMRRFTGDADADDVKHYALSMMREVLIEAAATGRLEMPCELLLRQLPSGVAVALRLDGPVAVRDAIKKHPKDFVVLDLTSPATTFDDFVVGRASAFRKAAAA